MIPIAGTIDNNEEFMTNGEFRRRRIARSTRRLLESRNPYLYYSCNIREKSALQAV